MVIDSKGNMFEDRRKKERREGENSTNINKKQDKRKGKDRRDPKNAYRP